VSVRPDILLLVLDTQRVDRLSCYGYTRPTSPNLDALAADATLFRRAYSAAQWTVPSHTSLFTGLYPSFHGTRQSDSMVPEALPTLAELLAAGGYHTAAFCNNPLVGVVNNGLRRGFDSFLNYSGWLTSRPNQAGRRHTLFGRYRQVFKRLLGGVLNKMQDAFARSDALLEFAMTPLMVPFWQTALSFKGNTPRSLNDTARLLIERKGVQPEQPIFCFVNLMGTHMPFHPGRRHMERFAPQMLQNRAARRYLRQFNSDVFGWFAPLADPMSAENKTIIDGMYDAEVATQDEHLGVFFQKLRTSGALDRTLLVICADHGEHLGEQAFVGHSVSLYNVLTHVPLIIRDPQGKLARGTVIDHPVSTRRVYHTMLTAADLADPTERAFTLDHLGEDDPDRGTVFAEAVTPQNVLNLMTKHKPQLVRDRGCDQPRRAVWRGPYKLIVTGDAQYELFNVVDDPLETRNLSAEQPAVVAELRERLRHFAIQAESSNVINGRVVERDDPQLRRHLRALGYLE
jgi:arylsulfatase A-like enzyme